jgi:hypothetical protein
MWFVINKTLVRSFFLQHAGFFLFLFIVFFGIVAPSQQLGYHYALIRGILEAPGFLALVSFAWLLYAGKVMQFVFRMLDSPEGLFLCRMRCLAPAQCYRLLLRVQHRLFLPVSGYAAIITGVAIWRDAWVEAVVVILYVAAICGVSATLYYRRLGNPGRISGRAFQRVTGGRRAFRRVAGGRWRVPVPYWSILLRFLAARNGWLLAVIKVLSCGLLYLLLRLQTPEDHDLRAVYFTYSMALFGHGILLLRCRKLEARRLLFYRTLAVSLATRLGQYGLFCLLLLLPEMLVLGWMTPNPIRIIDVLELAVTGYSLLLLVNGCLLIIPLRVSDFLKLWLVLLGIWYGCVLGGSLIAMSGFFVGAAVFLMAAGYYRVDLR